MDTLAADLSGIALRLLVAVLMAGGTDVVLSRRELEVRAGLSHNSLDLARSQLQARNLLTVESMGDGKSNRYTLHIGVGVSHEKPPVVDVEGMYTRESRVIAAFARHFPQEHKRYRLTSTTARKWLGMSDLNRVLLVMEQVSSKKEVKYPKAYIEKILGETEPEAESELEQATPEMLHLIRKGQRHEDLFGKTT